MEKTHWRKNKDPKFISGEDLKHGLVKGIVDGMMVEIAGVKEEESFDQNTQQKHIVSELRFKDMNGKALSKGMIPAEWTSKFMKRLGINSPFLEDWIGQKMIIFAQADKRFGYVVRFKKYTPPVVRKPELLPNTPNWKQAVEWLEDGKNTVEMMEGKYIISKENKLLLCKK